MICVTPYDKALDLVYGEFRGLTPSQIRSRSGAKLRAGEITREVYDAVVSIIGRWGIY